MDFNKQPLSSILEVGIMLSTEKDYNKLFEIIVDFALDITGCDGGTLYLYEDDHLVFKIMRTQSMGIYQGGNGEVIDLPPVPLKEENVCAYSALHREAINIANVYQSDRFDFSGPKEYDGLTGYHTQSMMVIPLENHGDELVGVLQLINAQDKEGNVIPFSDEYERVILFLASQAAIALSNMRYIEEIKDLLHSFVETMAAAIDERTPYNGNHTRNVAIYSSEFVDYLNLLYERGDIEEFFSPNRKEQLVLAASLHDIGKMIVPLGIMNKSTRLEKVGLERVLNRFELLRSYYRIDFYEGRMDESARDEALAYLDAAKALVHQVNECDFLEDALEAPVQVLAGKVYTKADGSQMPYLTEVERDCLLIKKGTLTAAEREIMENHVVMTSKILSNIHFHTHYKNVPIWAGSHHELLDGSGYPNHLTAEDMATEIRILSMVDIFEALTAVDRPYKKPMPTEQAVAILTSMAEEGKLDAGLVKLFGEYIVHRDEFKKTWPDWCMTGVELVGSVNS